MSILARLQEQERVFTLAFAAQNLDQTRPLHHPEVVYLSPTVRLRDGRVSAGR